MTLSLCESNLFFSKINPPRGESPKLAGKATKKVKRERDEWDKWGEWDEWDKWDKWEIHIKRSAPIYPIKRSAPIYPIKGAKGSKGS